MIYSLTHMVLLVPDYVVTLWLFQTFYLSLTYGYFYQLDSQLRMTSPSRRAGQKSINLPCF